MKNSKLYFISSLILLMNLILTADSFSQTGWTIKSTGGNINSVFFISPSNGWMVGDSGLAFATYDGGMTWSGLESKTNNNLYSVFFKNELTGWAAGSGGTIIKTTDAGNNWSLLTTGVTYGLNTIQFPTIDTGYAIGAAELRTTNGGATWTDYGLPLSSSSAFFTSAETGYYVDASHVFKTVSGGLTWSTFTLISSRAVFFANPNTGWAVTGSVNKYTTNAGANWVSQTMGGGFSTQYGVYFSDENSGWSVGSIETTGGNSSIRRTTNSGTNWTGQSSGTANILRSVYAVSGSYGVTVGDAGTVLLTTNGGSNWSNQLHLYSAPFTQGFALYSTYFADNSTGWSGGWDGIVNKTTNGGNNWTSAYSALFSRIYSVHFLGKDTGWICGQSGMIQKTVNGGSNWVSKSISVSNKFNDINIGRFTLTGFLGLFKIGWCVGDGGMIYRTTDEGNTWAGQLSGTAVNLNSVVAFSENVAVACGDSGKILRTTTGGSNWYTVVSGAVDGSLRSLSFADENTGICVGDSATVLYTTDKGATWYLDITGPRSLTTKNLYDVSARMDVMATYTAVGENGVIIKSEDEGSSWIKLSGGVKTRLNSISSPSDAVSYIAGSKGTVLKTIDGGALPVELLSFSCSLNGSNAELYWRTSQEINNYGFEIERSYNGGEWKKSGFVKGAGNSISEKEYTFKDKISVSGKYNYRLKQIDYNGNYEYFNLSSEVVSGNPESFSLEQNYPNPFNPSTKISYEIPYKSFVTLKIFDMTGREIRTLVNQVREAGTFEEVFRGDNLSSGIYFYTLTSGGFSQTKKLMLIK